MKSLLLPLLLLSLFLSGCPAPLIVGLGGAATGALVANDRRTAGTMLDDERIELNTLNIVSRDAYLRDNAHINATSFNGQLLLTGEVPDQASSKRLASQAAHLQRVTVVKNALLVGPVSSSDSRTADTAITSRVKSRLISELGAAQAQHIKVVTERATVYLMGLVSRTEAEHAVQVTRRTAGVERIVKVFEYQP